MKPDFDIIMLALPRWDGPYSSTAYSLAKELSRHTRVFYVDNPISIKEYFSKRNTPGMRRRKEALFFGNDFFTSPDKNYDQLFAITPRVTLPVNFLPNGFLYEKLSKINDQIISHALNRIVRIFGVKRYILINSFNPLFGNSLSLKLNPLLKVYQSVDDIRHAPYMDKHGPRLENGWVSRSDFSVVTSSELKKLKSQYSDHVYLLPNAANVNLFQRAMKEDLAKPWELKDLPLGKKIICYTGNICQRLDYELLKKVALHHADKILLMIGPFARNDYETSGLSKIPNVIFTGKKSIEELPAYLKFSDCCIIPFVRNELTKSIYPLKINEYLSAGKPVVTTNFSEDIQSFDTIAKVSKNDDDFINGIQQAIDEDTDHRRIDRMLFSAANNWEARAHHFIELSVEILKQQNGRTGFSERRKQLHALHG
jgi:teichuronic acid biosynthesis glycosyltransferase TuaH